jgi:hypothetical protein
MDEERPEVGSDRAPATGKDDVTAARQRDEGRSPPDDPTVVDLDDPADAGVGSDRPPRPPIEPESVEPEHAVFVALGAALTVVVVAGLV